MSKTRRAILGAFLWGALWTTGCSRSEQGAPPKPHAAADAGTVGVADASVGAATRTDKALSPPAPAAEAKLRNAAWPEELPTRWFEPAQDAKGSFVPVDCADRPLNQLVYREVPGGHQVVFQTPWSGKRFSLREVQRTDVGVEMKLAPSNQQQAQTQLVYQGQGRWLRDGKPLEFHPMGELDRWRVRRVCIGSPFYEDTTEEKYLSNLLAKPPKPGEEFQGRPPKPKLQFVPWTDNLLKGLPRHWVQPTSPEERTLQVGCDGVVRSTWLELRNEDGLLVLDSRYLPYLVTEARQIPGGLHLSLTRPHEGSVKEAVEIHYTPGAAEATWAWTLVADADTETRRVLTLEAAQALPQRVVCQ